jgi:hypothetical protein
MYFDFKTYFLFMYRAFFRSREAHFRMTPTRAIALALFFLLLFPLFELFTALCLMLDNVFFPGYRRIRLDTPLFIVGPHRSGTTFLQKLISKDETQFFCFRTWEILFPSILQKKVLAWLGRLDRRAGGPVEATIRRHEARILGEFRASRLSLLEPAEDDKLELHTFSSHALLWFAHSKGLEWSLHFDEKASERDRERIMGFYHRCIQRQAYFKGGDLHFLSKAPFACFRIRTIYHYFPGCRLIYTIRNPLDGVPSMMSTAKTFAEALANLDSWKAYKALAYETIKKMYRYPLAQFAQADERSYALVVHHDLLHNLNETVRRLYEKFGYELGEEFAAALAEADQKQREFRSTHQYSLEQFGLDREQILTDFQDIFERFGFDTRAPAKSEPA